MAFGFGTNYGRNAQSFEIYEKDRTRRETNPSFRDFHPVEYVDGFKGNSKKANYKWESEVLHDLPKTYGKSYNDKFETLMDEVGVPSYEREGFRKYLDAEEKGKLGSSTMDEIAADMKYRKFGGAIPGAEYKPSKPKQNEGDRSILDRTFDALLVGNYMSAGLADGVVNKGNWKTGWEQAKQGLKAANPFGDGNSKGEYTYSKVLENAGWKPDDNIERFNKGAAGFALDVLLDPTTYLTLGASALLKGTGKVGATVGKLGTGVIEKMEVSTAKQIVESAMNKKGKKLSDDEIARDAERLARKYNQLRGVREARDVTVGLGNLPFGDKIFGKTLGKTFKVGTNKPLQVLGDMTLAKPYAIARDFIYGSKIGKKLSPKHPMFKLAKENPEELAKTLKMMEITQGLHADKLASEKAIREYASKLDTEFTPDDQRQILELLQDKTIMADVKRMVKLSETNEAKMFAQKLTQRKDLQVAKLKTLMDDHNALEQLKSGYEDGILDLGDELKNAENELVEQLKQVDLDAIEDEKMFGEAIDLIRNKSKQLEEQFAGMSTPLKPELKLPPEPVEPKRPYNKKPKEPEYEPVPDLPMKQVQDESAAGIDEVNKGVIERWNKSDKGNEQKFKTVDELSQIIYGEPGKISKATYPADVDRLIDELKNGEGVEAIKWMIEQRPHFYDGRATDIYRHMGDKYGYGSGREYKNWEEYYDKRMNPITKKLEAGKTLTPQEKKLVEKLEMTRIERARDVALMKDMNKEELMEHLRKESERKLMKDFSSVEGSAHNAGFYDVVQDDVTKELRVVIRDKEARKSSDDLVADNREKFYDEDKASLARKTGEFDDKSVYNYKLLSDEKDEIMGMIGNSIAKKKEGRRLLSRQEREFAKQAADEVENVLRDVFKKEWHQLSKKQQYFATILARDNASEKMFMDKPDMKKLIADTVKKEQEKRIKVDLIKAVEKRAQVGSTVFFKQGEKVKGGEILAVGRDFDDLLEYKVMGHNGKEVTIKPEHITRVEKMTPQDILLKELTEEKPVKDPLFDEIANVNARNIEKEMDYQDELAKFEEKKAADKAKYDEDVSKFEQDHMKWVEDKELVEKLHKAELKQWQEAVTKSSFVANQFINQRKLLRNEIEQKLGSMPMSKLRADMKKEDVLKAFDAQKDRLIENIKNLEMSAAQMDKLIKDGAFDNADEIQKIQDNIQLADDALADDDALETLMRASIGNNKADAIVHMYSGKDTGQIVLDTRLDVPDKTKAIVKELRKAFQTIGLEEKKRFKLSEGQLHALWNEYVPHILEPEGAKLFKNKKIKFDDEGNMVLEDKLLNEKGLALTQDYGYGQKFNNHSLERTIKKIKMPDGTWVERPTIEQINQSLSSILKGKNAFSEKISDIYIARMLKHNEIMYDDNYMRTMMDTFGSDIPLNGTVKKGFVAVANYGLLKKSIYDITEARYQALRMKGTVADRNDVRKELIEQMGISERMLDDAALPMVELSEEQVKRIQRIKPDLVKQVNDAIALKANQARKIQIDKDQSRFLQLYDKFTHLMKLNQTTVMPAFHARNGGSNMYLNYLAIGRDAVNPKFKMHAFKAARFEGNPEKLKDLPKVNIGGKDMGWDELYDMAKAHQVIDEGFFAKDIGAGAATSGIKGGKFDPTDSENFFAYRMGGQIGNKIENHDRLIHFVSQLKNGKSVDEAKESVEKYLFDYSDLTAFEQSVMKRIFPYYTWLRKNGRLQLDQAIENPGRMRDAAKGVNMVEGGTNEEDRVERRYMSNFAKDWAQTPFNYTTKDGKKEPILWNPNLPFMDLARIPDPSRPVDSAINAFTQTVPQIKVPIEQALNKNFFFDDRIVDKDATMKEAAMARGMHAATQFAGFTAGEGLLSKEGVDKALHAGNILTGQKFLSYDYDTSKQMAIAREKGEMVKDEVPVDKLIRKVRNPKTFLSKEFRNAYKEETNHITQSLDRWLNGDVSESEMESYAPLVQMLHETANTFGIDVAKQKTFTRTVLESTKLDGKLLGKDFSKGKVTEVIDGDTFVVDFPGIGNKQKVRMLYVDTPETVDPDMNIKMPFGKDASKYTKQMLEEEDVQLVIDTRQHDAHGRLLAYVYHNGQDMNADVLEEGLGKVRYTGFSDEQYKVDDYKASERKAVDAKRGIWSIDDYATPGDMGYNEAIARRYGK